MVDLRKTVDKILQNNEITIDNIKMAFEKYYEKLDNDIHYEKITVFKNIYQELGYDKKIPLITEFVFLFNAILDSIDDSIDESPSSTKKNMYLNQIMIYTSFILIFEIASIQFDRIPKFIRNKLKSKLLLDHLKNSLQIVEIPQNEKKFNDLISKSHINENLIDYCLAFFNSRTTHTKLCAEVVDIFLKNSKSMSRVIQNYFSLSNLFKDIKKSEIERDLKNNSANLYLILKKNPNIEKTQIKEIILKVIDRIMKILNHELELLKLYQFKESINLEFMSLRLEFEKKGFSE